MDSSVKYRFITNHVHMVFISWCFFFFSFLCLLLFIFFVVFFVFFLYFAHMCLKSGYWYCMLLFCSVFCYCFHYNKQMILPPLYGAAKVERTAEQIECECEWSGVDINFITKDKKIFKYKQSFKKTFIKCSNDAMLRAYIFNTDCLNSSYICYLCMYVWMYVCMDTVSFIIESSWFVQWKKTKRKESSETLMHISMYTVIILWLLFAFPLSNGWILHNQT